MTPTIYHAVEMHDREPDARKEKAFASWKGLYERGVVPVHYWTYRRDARQIGDPRALPYFLDVVQPAVDACKQPDDIVVFSNEDIVLHPLLPDLLRLYIGLFDVCTSFRCEFNFNPMPPILCSPEHWTLKASAHMGRDLICATAKWWTEHWDEIPDWILGAPTWDLAMATLVRHKKGFRTTRKNLDVVIPCCELPRGYIGHETHASVWNSLPNETPSHRHNLDLFKAWQAKHCPEIPLPL